jgi:hypothetical protein
VSAILGAFLAALVRGFLDYLGERRKEEALREFGAAQERARASVEINHAEARMREANALRRDDSAVLDRLRDGTA